MRAYYLETDVPGVFIRVPRREHDGEIHLVDMATYASNPELPAYGPDPGSALTNTLLPAVMAEAHALARQAGRRIRNHQRMLTGP